MIQVENLSKHFTVRNPQKGNFALLRNFISSDSKILKAVDDISFKVNRGEIVGYLGPNGAGKSTTIKMLTGLLVPTSGQLEVNGFVPWKSRQPVHRQSRRTRSGPEFATGRRGQQGRGR